MARRRRIQSKSARFCQSFVGLAWIYWHYVRAGAADRIPMSLQPQRETEPTVRNRLVRNVQSSKFRIQRARRLPAQRFQILDLSSTVRVYWVQNRFSSTRIMRFHHILESWGNGTARARRRLAWRRIGTPAASKENSYGGGRPKRYLGRQMDGTRHEVHRH